MPITILDYVRSTVGERLIYTVEDHWNAGVDILGGCQICHATIASYNAYPSTSGHWRCADCIGDTGFATIDELTALTSSADEAPVVVVIIQVCPSCGNPDNIHEIRLTTSECTAEHALECGDCGTVWQS